MKEQFSLLFPDNRQEGKTTLKQAQLIMLRLLKIVDYICRKHNLKYWMDAGTLLGAVRHKGFIPWDDDVDIAMPRQDYNRFIEIAKKELPEDLFLQYYKTDEGYDMPWLKIRDTNSLINEYKIGNYHRGIFIDIFPMDSYREKGNKMNFIRSKYKVIYRILTLIKEPYEKINSKKLLIKNIIKSCLKVILFVYTLKSKKCILKKLNILKEKYILKIEDKNGKYIGSGIELFWDYIIIEKSDIYPLKEIEFENFKFLAPNNCDKYLKTEFGDYMKLPPEEERIPHNLGIKPILSEETVKCF